LYILKRLKKTRISENIRKNCIEGAKNDKRKAIEENRLFDAITAGIKQTYCEVSEYAAKRK